MNKTKKSRLLDIDLQKTETNPLRSGNGQFLVVNAMLPTTPQNQAQHHQISTVAIVMLFSMLLHQI